MTNGDYGQREAVMNLVFESERLEFRPLQLDDVDLAIALWTDPEVVRYVSYRTYSEAELAEEMPIVTRRCGGGCIGIWMLRDKASREKIGTALLLPMPVELDDTDWDLVQGEGIPEGDIEVGYTLKRSAWGKGYATEACRRMLRFAFEETPLDVVAGTIDPNNAASRHVLRKSGLRELGLIRAYGHDIPGFRITRQRWLDDQGG
ncbi:MAG: GNAT family N-acetyltransferase [Pseudomonadota bacterium]